MGRSLLKTAHRRIGIPLLRILTDRGTEYCGAREHHEYQLYLAIEDLDHSKTKARHPQSNGICERFHTTAPWEVLLRQDSDANVSGQPPIGERKDVESNRRDNR
jgi:transposase InsO family protein